MQCNLPACRTLQQAGANDIIHQECCTSNNVRKDPQLELLEDNGGPTKTMAIPSNSIAIGKGTSDGAPVTDQRGVLRKNPPDIGVYEYNQIIL